MSFLVSCRAYDALIEVADADLVSFACSLKILSLQTRYRSFANSAAFYSSFSTGEGVLARLGDSIIFAVFLYGLFAESPL